MIEANRKWLEHYRNDPKLYPLVPKSWSLPAVIAGMAEVGYGACVCALGGGGGEGVQGGPCLGLGPSLDLNS